jgi:hypothetical protein
MMKSLDCLKYWWSEQMVKVYQSYSEVDTNVLDRLRGHGFL